MNLAECVELALAGMDPEIRETFADGPKAALRGLGLTARAVDTLGQRGDGGSCDGVSFVQDRVVLYAPTESRRQNFTLAHEAGHFLVEQNDDVMVWLAELKNTDRMLENVCDQIAQELLLPKELIDSTLNGDPPMARNLSDMFWQSSASEQVCAIALANRLKVMGAVVIADRFTCEVTFVSVHPGNSEDWPLVYPRKGDQLPGGAVRLPLGNMRDDAFSGRIEWTDRYRRTDIYYTDAVATPKRLHIVLAERDLWGCEPLHVGAGPAVNAAPVIVINCCGEARQVRGWPCQSCHEPYCPVCGKCVCGRADARAAMCTKCFMRVAAHLVVNGVCVDCR
jgi:hypothetical protein